MYELFYLTDSYMGSPSRDITISGAGIHDIRGQVYMWWYRKQTPAIQCDGPAPRPTITSRQRCGDKIVLLFVSRPLLLDRKAATAIHIHDFDKESNVTQVLLIQMVFEVGG